jgi:hypothetical protein
VTKKLCLCAFFVRRFSWVQVPRTEGLKSIADIAAMGVAMTKPLKPVKVMKSGDIFAGGGKSDVVDVLTGERQFTSRSGRMCLL